MTGDGLRSSKGPTTARLAGHPLHGGSTGTSVVDYELGLIVYVVDTQGYVFIKFGFFEGWSERVYVVGWHDYTYYTPYHILGASFLLPWERERWPVKLD